MNCASSCPTQNHSTWGQCIRAQNQAILYCRSATEPLNDATAAKKWDKELAYYRSVRAQGIQPISTQTAAIEAADRAANEIGEAV